MGAMKLMILLLLIIFSFTFPVSFSQLDKHSAKPPILHESDGSVSGVNNGAVNQSKFAGGGARGGGGHSAGESSSGQGGQPQRGGAGAVIPVYAAGSGAAAKNNNHRSTASVCIKCQKDTLLIIGLTSFLLYLSK
ncbi:hypothetical protein R6Q59_029858 [Mikania micrantha]